MSDLFLAVETGGTKLQFVLGDAQGCIVQRSRLSVARERGFQGILEGSAVQHERDGAAANQLLQKVKVQLRLALVEAVCVA